MSPLMPRFTTLCLVLVVAGTYLGLIAEIRGQTPDEVAARIVSGGGAVSRDDEGKVDTVLINLATDNFVDSIDFSVFGELRSVTIFSYSITDKSLIHLRKTIQVGRTHLH